MVCSITFADYLATGIQFKCPHVRLQISLSLNIVGNIWDDVGHFDFEILASLTTLWRRNSKLIECSLKSGLWKFGYKTTLQNKALSKMIENETATENKYESETPAWPISLITALVVSLSVVKCFARVHISPSREPPRHPDRGAGIRLERSGLDYLASCHWW